jgi:hypothetical protein
MLKTFGTRSATLAVLWANMMLMAAASIACPYIATLYSDPYTVMLVWSWIWGIGAVVCGIAFFCLLVFVES